MPCMGNLGWLAAAGRSRLQRRTNLPPVLWTNRGCRTTGQPVDMNMYWRDHTTYLLEPPGIPKTVTFPFLMALATDI